MALSIIYFLWRSLCRGGQPGSRRLLDYTTEGCHRRWCKSVAQRGMGQSLTVAQQMPEGPVVVHERKPFQIRMKLSIGILFAQLSL